MKIFEIVTEQDQFGVKTPTVQQVCDMHGVDLEQLLPELEKGIKVELEHTKDTNIAREIALDHLAERPDYYTQLAKIDPH